MTDYDIHSCGYYCHRPACIEAQRNELRDKLFSDQAVKTYSGGKPNYTQPIEPEPKIDGWPLYSGLPTIKPQDKTFEEFAQSFAQRPQPEEKFYKQAVDGTIPEACTPAKGGLLPKREPSGSWVSWDNTMCNPVADARMQTQSAWADGYASAKAEWVGLTEEDIKDIEGWVEFKEAGSNERVPLGKLALYISHKIREKNT
jgi:hypothetical protein